MKRVLHIVLASSVLFSMVLGVLPDVLLDYTHSHTHERPADHHEEDGMVITAKHYDCELPDFYFEHYLPDTRAHITYTEPVAADVTPFTASPYIPVTDIYFSLRAPPYNAHS